MKRDNTVREWKAGDTFVPLPKEGWGDEAYCVGWHPDMFEFIGKELEVERVRSRTVRAKGWNWGFAQITPPNRVFSLTIVSYPL